MDAITIGVGAGCLAAGAALGWWIAALRAVGAGARQRTETGAQIAGLTERVAAREQLALDLQTRLAAAEAAAADLRRQLSDLQSARARLQAELENEQAAAAEKLALIEAARTQLADTFQALSAQALQSNNESFLQLARAAMETQREQASGDLERRQQAIGELVAPVRETLQKFEATMQKIETTRAGAYQGLVEQVRGLQESQEKLRAEASNLVRALGTPRVRGRWGEIQLRRVVELAGMLDHCDFEEQVSTTGDEGRMRPDMIVRLPGGRQIVVDAKAPLAAYLEALEAKDDDARLARLRDHARQIRDHLTALGRKSYWDQFDFTPEFVVLFLPGETFFSAALEQDPSLIEQGVNERVILATPTTLIALLKAVSYGWRQQKLADNAKEISELGRELYRRLATLGSHIGDLGTSLGRAVDAYNRGVASLETRVLPQGRRFLELEAAGGLDEIPALSPIEQQPRTLQAPEMTKGGKDEGGMRDET